MKYLFFQLQNAIQKHPKYIYALLVLLIVFERIYLFLNFSIIYTDSDQTLLWQATQDLMNGKFHGFCFYGQSYNPLIEAVLAIPFVYFGMEIYKALPLVTIILSTIPFFVFAYYFYKKINVWSGLIPLIICLLLSVEYDMLTAIPRGFVIGLFFASFGIVFINFHQSVIAKFFGGILCGFAIYINPNSVLLFPIIFPFVFQYRKSFFKVFYPSFIGFILGISTLLINNYYYYQHPEMLVHPAPKITIAWSNFETIISRLDYYFDFVNPLFWRAGWLTLLLFIFAGIRLWKFKFRKEAFTLMVVFFLIISTFFVSKVLEATNSVFFSGARMYLAYPFLLIFLVLFYTYTLNQEKSLKFYSLFILISCVSFLVKIFGFGMFTNHAMQGSKYTVVKVMEVKKLKENCENILKFSDKNIDLILPNSGSSPSQLIAYGCPCLLEKFPKTLLSFYERRTWLLPEINNETYPQILIYGTDKNLWDKMNLKNIKILKKDDNNQLLLIDNTLKTKNLMDELQLNEIQ